MAKCLCKFEKNNKCTLNECMYMDVMDDDGFVLIANEKPTVDGRYTIKFDTKLKGLGIMERTAKYIVENDDWYDYSYEVGFYNVRNVIAWKPVEDKADE